MTYRRDFLNDGLAVRHATHRDLHPSEAPRRRLVGDAPPSAPVPNPSGALEVILVKTGFKQVAVRVGEIVCIESSRNYVHIRLENGTTLKSRVPIGRIARHLGTDRFLRVHRGCLVSMARVQSIASLTGGRLLLNLGEAAKVVVARDRRRAVLAEIGMRASSRA
jgi:two-component system LytT family response regulator